MLDGVLQSLILFCMVFFANFLSAGEDGRPVELWNCGTVLYTSVIIAVHLRLAISLQYWTRVHHVIIWGSVGAWFVYLLVYGAMDPDISNEVSGLFIHITGPSVRAWFVGVALAPVAAVLPALYMKALNRQHYKRDHEIIQEVDNFGGYIEGRLVMYGRKSPNSRRGKWSRRRSSVALGGSTKKYSGYSGGGADDAGEEVQLDEDGNVIADAVQNRDRSGTRTFSPALQKLDEYTKKDPKRHRKQRSERRSIFGMLSRSRSREQELAEDGDAPAAAPSAAAAGADGDGPPPAAVDGL